MAPKPCYKRQNPGQKCAGYPHSIIFHALVIKEFDDTICKLKHPSVYQASNQITESFTSCFKLSKAKKVWWVEGWMDGIAYSNKKIKFNEIDCNQAVPPNPFSKRNYIKN